MNATKNRDAREPLAEQAGTLDAGREGYRGYVGPAEQYDFMGATQFRLLTALGLRENHKLLDFGCGALRAGKLFIPYLLPGGYFGLDPNKWLIDEAIEKEIGRDIITLKRPTFRHDDNFRATQFETSFDFILAQSIFSHTGSELVAKVMSEFRACLKPDGLVLATFVLPHQLGNVPEFTGQGWVYPEAVAFEAETVLRMIAKSGLVGKRLAWFHPRQTWFAISHSVAVLPESVDDTGLSTSLQNEVDGAQSFGQRLRDAVVRRIKKLRT